MIHIECRKCGTVYRRKGLTDTLFCPDERHKPVSLIVRVIDGEEGTNTLVVTKAAAVTAPLRWNQR